MQSCPLVAELVLSAEIVVYDIHYHCCKPAIRIVISLHFQRYYHLMTVVCKYCLCKHSGQQYRTAKKLTSHILINNNSYKIAS